jgi:hypothetical protein
VAELISNINAQANYEANETVVDAVQVSVDATAAYERGKRDINFFAGLALPEVAIYALPYFYCACFNIIVNRTDVNIGKIIRFALGLPRGHAKTTFIKILLAWLIAYDRAKFVLVVCATQPNANNLVSDLSAIMGSPNMEAIYGKWTEALDEDNKMTKIAIYHGRPVILEGRGAQTAVRGINKDNHRPDVILCDDMQTKENDASPAESAALIKWFVSTLLKTIDTRCDRLIIYIGNMYSDTCILKQLQNSASWISLITGAILEDGEPLWPELHSLESLMESFTHDASLGLEEEWFAEVMNDPRNAKTSLLHDKLPMPDIVPAVYDGTFLTIDLAGYRTTSDDNVIVGHGVWNDVGYVLKTIAGRMTPEETIKVALTLAVEINATVIGIESVGYQQTFKFWMEFYMKAMDIHGIDVVELQPHGRSKQSRIMAFIQELYAGTYVHASVEERAVFTFQANAYKIGKKDNKDDILDGQAYGMDMRRDHWDKIGRSLNDRLLQQQAYVIEDNTPF